MAQDRTDNDQPVSDDEQMELPGMEGSDSPVEDDPVCAICGHPIAPDDIECPNCGTSLVAG